MRILDRYILKSILRIFLTCIFSFLFLYIIIDIISCLEDLLRQKAAISVLIRYYLSYLPIIFVQVSPFSCLLATLFTFGHLNRNNELIAMRTAGLNIFQITKIAIIFGIIISTLVFLVNDRFVPSSITLTQKIKDQMEAGTKKARERESETIANLSMYGLRNRLFFVNKLSFADNAMEGIIILENDRYQNVVKKIMANKGVYQNGVWTFYDCVTYDLDENGQIIAEPRYLKEEIMDIPDTPHDFLSQRQRPDSMTIKQINDYIRKLSTSGATTVIRNLKVDLYRKFSEPLTSLVIILLGIPFSFKVKKRAAGLASLGISIIMGFLYYVLNAVGIAFGKSGILIPALSASLGHIVALFVSLYMISELS